jgi:asparagine synthase (glutamine-hydrolysing)
VDALLDALAADEAAHPLTFAAGVRTMPVRQGAAVAMRNRRILASRRGVDVRSPLLHPEVVHALAREGGRLGPGDRTAVLRHLAGDLLPDAVLARTTKAEFGGAYMAGPTRAFAAEWTGAGVDPALVDRAALRSLWQGEHRLAPTAALLQAAWLGDHATGSDSAK